MPTIKQAVAVLAVVALAVSVAGCATPTNYPSTLPEEEQGGGPATDDEPNDRAPWETPTGNGTAGHGGAVPGEDV